MSTLLAVHMCDISGHMIKFEAFESQCDSDFPTCSCGNSSGDFGKKVVSIEAYLQTSFRSCLGGEGNLKSYLKEDDITIARLLSAIGPQALEHFNNFTWATAVDKAKYKDVMDKFQREFAGKTLKERLWRETGTSLQKVIDLCCSSEITKKEIQSMQSVKCNTSSSTEPSVHVIKSSPQSSPVIDEQQTT
ncbi:hypothetical protein P5673_033756 [Acropora cervicornis]|uniref:Uncharacterized protein n=1 Tax=Acropora cervicornis TaxID=6130 RepID=A0AAD9PPH2_ACRCE|nr:hypothetical protein P5673_033756 [Acropora cervicornis]